MLAEKKEESAGKKQPRRVDREAASIATVNRWPVCLLCSC